MVMAKPYLFQAIPDAEKVESLKYRYSNKLNSSIILETMKKASPLFLFLLFVLISVPGLSQDNDKALVQAALEDYVNALYEVDPSKIERSVDTTLRKIGYW